MDSLLQTFSSQNFQALCDDLAAKDIALKAIQERFGYPPMWVRPNTFETLVHIIVEQQVSLASAKAALIKLQKKVQDITPAKILDLEDNELKSCYFSRQKSKYVKNLANALLSGRIDLQSLETLPDEDVRKELITIKGIGNWTIDVYLIFVLHRLDVFPMSDLAAINALKRLKSLSKEIPHADLLEITTSWKPYRSIATMFLWHYYLSLRAEK